MPDSILWPDMDSAEAERLSEVLRAQEARLNDITAAISASETSFCQRLTFLNHLEYVIVHM